jgi:translocation and assembly module TamB
MTDERKPEAVSTDGTPQPKQPHGWMRVVGWIAGSLLVLLLLVVAGAAYYTTTPSFDRRARTEVVTVLENATGGRVEIGGLKFDLWHLAIEVDGLVIHGTEGPGQMPYLSADKILLRVRINTFISHTVGKGAQSHIGLNYLRVEQPHFHLIIEKDGRTNQPVPKKPSTSTEPVQDTLLDLQAGKVELANGLAVINDRAVPFDVAARNMSAEVHYIASDDRYGTTIDLADLVTKIAKQPDVHSQLHLTAQLGRNMMSLNSFDYATGARTHLTASGLIQNFANPQWQGTLQGNVELKQLGYLAGIEGFSAGVVSVDMHGHNCVVTPQQAQQNPGFWKRHAKRPAPPAAKVLPPDPDCTAGYLFVGNVRARGVDYRIPEVRVRNTDAAAQLRVTPTELLFSALTGTLPGGGKVSGELKIENWLGEVPASAPAQSPTAVAAATAANKAAVGVNAKPPVQSMTLTPVSHAQAYLTVNVEGISLRTIMEFTAPEHYPDLGFDTGITGPVRVQWGGPVTNISDSVQVDADLKFRPTGYGVRGSRVNIPLSGVVQGHYDGRSETVTVRALNVQTPATSLAVKGVLGVNNGDPLTNLQANLTTTDLGEFDQTLQALGFENNGKRGTAALPVVLHGTLNFNGSARGAVRNLDVKGALTADNLNVQLGSEADVHIDSVVANAEYSPNNGLAVASSTIKRNSAVLNFVGTARPHRLVSRHGVVSYAWDKYIGVDATLKLANAPMADLLDMAGQAKNVPVSGTVNLNAKVDGTLANPNGSGEITLTNGVAYGERYQKVAVDLTVAGQQLTANNVLVQAHGMQVTGSGGYNLTTKRVQAKLAGNDIVLSKLDVVQRASLPADGTLSFAAAANGTVTEPNLHANLKLADVTVEGKPAGDLTATADSVGSTVNYRLNASVVGAQIGVNGSTSLLGEYQTNVKASLTNIDVAKILAAYTDSTVKASSQIAATIELAGPAKDPQKMTGTLDFSQFDVNLQGVQLQTVRPLTATLRDGTVSLDQWHITGTDTDIKLSGSAKVLGDNDPNGGRVNLNGNGTINMALVHTFDPDLITDGKIDFQVAADGRMKEPDLTGQVRFQNVNIAMDGIPNGISQMNGTMVFNEGRLDVQKLTAVSGGGLITLGGSILYQKGLFADITASAKAVRVRYAGLSATANADLRLQGGPASLYLSGNVLVTRFEVGKDVDFAMFAGAGGVSLPPDPTSPQNRLRLNVHVQSSQQMDFQNSYAKLAGSVDLTVRGTLAVPSVLGNITITEGSATFAGTKYELDRGSIYFTNPVRIDPVVDLDVSTRVENYDVTIGVHGTMANLVPTYRSSPPLTEPDIFNLLALGRTQEESQLYSQQQTQAGEDPTTNALLGGALNATVSSRVGKLFGAGSVKIDPAFVGTLGNSAARITVEEPLSKQLTLTFATNVNQTAEQLIQLQYQINDTTSLVATRDENNVFSIVYKIRKRYR